MKLTKLIAVVGVAGVLAAGSADAQLSQTQSFDFVPNGNQVMTFNKVNLNLVDVTGIIVTIELNKTGGSLAVDNDSANSGTLTFTHTLDGALTSSNSLIDAGFSTTWTNLDVVSSTNQAVGATSGDPTDQFNVTAFSDYFQFIPADGSNSVSTSLNSAIWGQYLGASGTYTMTFDANQLANISGFGGLQQAFTVSEASGTVTVQVVPEPSSIALLLGAGGAALMFRRRAAARQI